MPAIPSSSSFSTDFPVVRFWGVRGSIPAPGPQTAKTGGNTACVELVHGRNRLVLDAGTGIRPLGAKLLRESEAHDGQAAETTLLLSHLHWDHIQGFPFFGPIYQPGYRIRVLAPGRNHAEVARQFRGQMAHPYFPVGFEALPAKIRIEATPSKKTKIGPFQIESIAVNHPSGCLGYRIKVADKLICYLPDNELALRLPPSEPVHLTDAKLAEFITDADLLIMDAQYNTREYHSHAGWGHGCQEDVVRLACGAGVRQLCLFHHDPDHTDRALQRMHQRMKRLAKKQSSTTSVLLAREGLQLLLR